MSNDTMHIYKYKMLNIKKYKELLVEACDEIVEGSEFLMKIRFRV